MSEILLKANEINKSFGGIRALRGVTVKIEKNKVVSLIGPNGAGKTTLFNIISGELEPDSGKIFLNSDDITNYKSYQCSRKGISRTYQQKNIFSGLTLFENIEAGYLSKSISKEERIEKVESMIEFLNLKGKEDKIAESLPPLDVKLVELGRALATDPKVLLLDELIGGLIKEEMDYICDLVKKLKKQGYTIFQVGHEMGPIMKTSDWIFVIDQGENLAEGTPEQIQKNKRVLEVYLETTGDNND